MLATAPKPMRSLTKTQQNSVYERIKDSITSGELTSGSRITELELAARLEVKRGPVRESLIRLEGEGYVRKSEQTGYFIEDYSLEDKDDIRDVRLSLESIACRQAASNHTREDIVKLSLIIEEAAEAIETKEYHDFTRLDEEFHRQIIFASKSKILMRIYSVVRLPIFSDTAKFNLKDMRKTLSDHRQVLTAIKNRDGDLAFQLISEHLDFHNGIIT